MNMLNVIPFDQTKVGKFSITVQAGDVGALSTVFQGNIYRAWVDAQAMPDVAFRVEAVSNGGPSTTSRFHQPV